MEHHGTSWIIMELRIECRLIMIDPQHLFLFFSLFSLSFPPSFFSLFSLFFSLYEIHISFVGAYLRSFPGHFILT